MIDNTSAVSKVEVVAVSGRKTGVSVRVSMMSLM
jgi:hypothetical protein